MLEGTDIAVRKQLDRNFNNITQTEHTVLGGMMGLDTFYGRSGGKLTVRKAPLKAAELQVNYETGLPRSQGIDATNPDFESRKLPLGKGYKVIGGKLAPAAFQLGPEVIDRYEVNRLEGDEALADWVENIAEAAHKSMINTINGQLFPTSAQLAPTTTGGYNGQAQKDQIMAFGYALQAGGSGNVAGVSGTTVYMLHEIDINLTANQGIRATQAGTSTTPFGNMSPSNLRTKLLIPTRKNGGRPDLLVLGAGPFNYMISNAEDSVRLTQSTMLSFGSEFAGFPGMTVLLEHALTDLEAVTSVAEGYLVDSSELLFSMEGDMKSFTIIDEVEQAPTMWMMQGYREGIFFIRNPRKCAHAFGIKY